MQYRDRAGAAGADWKQERPELDFRAMVLFGRLGEAAQLVMTHHATPFMARYGLKVGEFDVLSTLRRAGAPYELNPTDLYATTMLSSGGMTSRLDRLAEAGLIERRPDPNDRRGTRVALTPKGLDLIDGMIEAHTRNKQALAADMSQAEQEQLSALLAKLIHSVDPAAKG